MHLAAGGELGCFHFSAGMDTVAMSICIKIFARTYMFSILLGRYLGVSLC